MCEVQPTNTWKHWETSLEMPNIDSFWKQIVQKRLHITNIHIREFYVKYIYRCYLLNTRLHIMKYRTSPNCTLCYSAPETRVHLFWECPKVAPSWTKVIAFCKQHVDPNTDYCRNNCLLLGFQTPVLNLIVTLLKYHIHIARLYKHTSNYFSLLRKLCAFHIKEFSLCNFVQGWFPSKCHQYWGALILDTPFAHVLDS